MGMPTNWLTDLVLWPDFSWRRISGWCTRLVITNWYQLFIRERDIPNLHAALPKLETFYPKVFSFFNYRLPRHLVEKEFDELLDTSVAKQFDGQALVSLGFTAVAQPVAQHSLLELVASFGRQFQQVVEGVVEDIEVPMSSSNKYLEYGFVESILDIFGSHTHVFWKLNYNTKERRPWEQKGSLYYMMLSYIA